MKFGLEQHIIDKLIAVFEQNSKVDKALVFGSRAKGNYRTDSDIDIAIKGQDLNTDDIIAMSVAFEEKGITHKIDLINYDTIKEPDLKDHINRIGIELYSRWKEYKLSELADITSSKRIFYAEYVNEGVPFYRSKEIINKYNKQEIQTELFITEKKFKEIKSKFGVPVKDDILLTSVGTLGIPYLVTENDYFYFKDGNLTWFRNIDKSKVVVSYFYIWLQSRIGKQKLDEIAIGSTQPALTIAGLKSIEILLPNLEEQTAIAAILSSLDDKIDLLHRQNKTLEQLAETLFRQWFVEEAEESWEAVRLEKLGKIICGKTPSKKVSSYFNGEYPFIKIPDMHGNTYVFESIDSLTEQGLNSQQNKTIPPKSICVSCIATVGLVVMNAKTSQTNQQINSLIPSKDIYRYFIYLKMLSMKDDLLAMASGGTATDNLNTGDFSKIEIQFPSEKILKEFHEKVSPMFDKIYTNQTQIRTLTQTRDTLLPKLMSGEVRVNLN